MRQPNNMNFALVYSVVVSLAERERSEIALDTLRSVMVSTPKNARAAVSRSLMVADLWTVESFPIMNVSSVLIPI